jgi:glycosyltransferase involved in cell wall biosynthesis
MYLNPFVSVALHVLAREVTQVRWLAWCEDVSEQSRFWPALSRREKSWVVPAPIIEYVAISESRRRDLATVLGLPLAAIRVVRPPLDSAAWLGLGEEAEHAVAETRLLDRFPVVLVPQKLLPHKRLDLAVTLARELLTRAHRPLVLVSGAPSPHDSAASAATLELIDDRARACVVGDGLQVLSRLLGHSASAKTIRELMLLSDLVFLPSEEEGFGMPLLEAAALRVPVLCADIPPFREAGGGGATYFRLSSSPERIAGLAVEMASATLNRTRREALLSARHFEADLDRVLEGRS